MDVWVGWVDGMWGGWVGCVGRWDLLVWKSRWKGSLMVEECVMLTFGLGRVNVSCSHLD